jgi:hypothetical protein
MISKSRVIYTWKEDEGGISRRAYAVQAEYHGHDSVEWMTVAYFKFHAEAHEYAAEASDPRRMVEVVAEYTNGVITKP